MHNGSYAVLLTVAGTALDPDIVTFITNQEPHLAYRRGDILPSDETAASGKWQALFLTNVAEEIPKRLLAVAQTIVQQRDALLENAGVDDTSISLYLSRGLTTGIRLSQEVLEALTQSRATFEIATFDNLSLIAPYAGT